MRLPPAETPLMRQFLDVKDRYPDAIVFFRLGDFYEMFFEDALTAAKLLDLTLTTRDKGREDAVPMCGVPHHAARGYVARLVEAGHKVVIAEQVEDPRFAKGIVKREVVRVVTPGVQLDEEALDAKAPRYLAAVVPGGRTGPFGLAYLDVTTGEFRATELDDLDALGDELARVDAREVLGADDDLHGEGAALAPLCARFRAVAFSSVELPDEAAARARLDEAVAGGPPELREPGLARAVRAAAAVVDYARATQPAGALPLVRLAVYRPGETLVLDEACKTNLELTETIVGRKKHGSLLGVLDDTATAPGGRLLRRWLLFPLTDVAQIRRRQDAVELLVEQASVRAELRARLAEVYDLERLAGRVKLGTATPRDLVALRRSLEALPDLAASLARALHGSIAPPELLVWRAERLAPLAQVAADVAATLVDDPPAQLGAGTAIRPGASAEIDELRALADGGKDAILGIEARERERTGIGSLKIRYNRVFGYYLEVTRSNLKAVPADYVRKQTLANAERYVTPELAELEAKVLGAEDRLTGLEKQAFEALRARVAARLPALAEAAERVAVLDVCAALAECAHRRGWVRPLVDDGETLEIDEGRHPVVEELAAAGGFVPNDCRLDPAGAQILVITGPNMAGKSTYMRQVAHIALLAQMGAFVPAKRARLGVCDRIFTRVGAADNLARGESTFMVEMRETAHILAHATRRSLVVLDEIGRGTSTYDGVSIAFAVAEYLHDAVGAKTLFATHYHELTVLAARRPRVRNVSVAVREHRGEVVFLRRVVEGGAPKSYGIEVARLAGLPRSVISRARQVLAELERHEADDAPPAQLSLMAPAKAVPAPPSAEAEIVAALRETDPDHLTPMQALALVADLKRLIPKA
jgi:DNA mismatch repair protein MutS